MKSFNEANSLLHELLATECIFDIDYDNIKIESWFYQSNYPLNIPIQKVEGAYHFFIYLYQWDDLHQSLKLYKLKYNSAPEAQIVYVSNTEFENYVNVLAKNILEKKDFSINIKPLILSGFREIALMNLM